MYMENFIVVCINSQPNSSFLVVGLHIQKISSHSELGTSYTDIYDHHRQMSTSFNSSSHGEKKYVQQKHN
jgi:hypothetical protein